MCRTFTVIVLIYCLFAVAGIGQPPVHPGIVLYREGKNAEAITSLSAAVKSMEFKNDAEVWNHLGLAQSKSADNKNAQKSLEKAAKLAPRNSAIWLHLAYVYAYLNQSSKAESAVDKAISLGAGDAAAYQLRGAMRLRAGSLNDAEGDAKRAIELDPTSSKGYILIAYIAIDRLGQKGVDISNTKEELRFLDAALATLKAGAERCKGSEHCDAIAIEWEAISVYRDYFAKEQPSKQPWLDPDPNVTPLKLLSKPKVPYTDAARQDGKQGTIKLLVLFRADGKIGRVLFINRLGSGLDENVLRSASQITFEPKKIHGKPVSVVKLIEYGFAIY